MYGPDVVILLMYVSHDMRHIGFHRLTVVNETPGMGRHSQSTNKFFCSEQETTNYLMQ